MVLRSALKPSRRALPTTLHGYARGEEVAIMSDVAEIWVWTLELVPSGAAAMPDITGYEVSARDGTIGKVEEVVNGADGRSYIVVDTGFWIFEKKRMIPAGAIDTIDHKNRRI